MYNVNICKLKMNSPDTFLIYRNVSTFSNDQDQVPIPSVMHRVVMTSLEPGSRAPHPTSSPPPAPGMNIYTVCSEATGHGTRHLVITASISRATRGHAVHEHQHRCTQLCGPVCFNGANQSLEPN